MLIGRLANLKGKLLCLLTTLLQPRLLLIGLMGRSFPVTPSRFRLQPAGPTSITEVVVMEEVAGDAGVQWDVVDLEVVQVVVEVAFPVVEGDSRELATGSVPTQHAKI